MAASEALSLLDGMTELCVAKGRKLVRVDLTADDRPADDDLAGMMTSRWGKLRAPAMRVGTTFVVGFNRDMLATIFGTGGD